MGRMAATRLCGSFPFPVKRLFRHSVLYLPISFVSSVLAATWALKDDAMVQKKCNMSSHFILSNPHGQTFTMLLQIWEIPGNGEKWGFCLSRRRGRRGRWGRRGCWGDGGADPILSGEPADFARGGGRWVLLWKKDSRQHEVRGDERWARRWWRGGDRRRQVHVAMPSLVSGFLAPILLAA